MIKPREKELGIFFDDDFDSAARKVVDVAQKQKFSAIWFSLRRRRYTEKCTLMEKEEFNELAKIS